MTKLPTFFAPAERVDDKSILGDSLFLSGIDSVRGILNAVPQIGLILNAQRQVVFANASVIETLGYDGIELLLGKRPGELLNCENAVREPGGCGTSKYCQLCGAARVILESQTSGKPVSGECRIVSANGSVYKAWDFRCVASPFRINENNYTILSLLDISDEKRRRAMERIFFHDLINTASGLDGFINFIREVNTQQEIAGHIGIVRRLSKRLLDEIIAQRELLQAEENELSVRIEDVYSLDLLCEAINFMAYHSIAENRQIVTDPEADNIHFHSDPTLLRRVLINMLKNALEACNPHEEVSAGCYRMNDEIVFRVSNPGVIPADIRKQIFQRSFSTKGSDRGLGTWSMRLLTEKYLKGKISFTTDKENGTVFRLILPLDQPGD